MASAVSRRPAHGCHLQGIVVDIALEMFCRRDVGDDDDTPGRDMEAATVVFGIDTDRVTGRNTHPFADNGFMDAGPFADVDITQYH